MHFSTLKHFWTDEALSLQKENRNIMSIKEYRLTSMMEPSDEMLHELMEQVAESARRSTAHAQLVLQKKMQETIAEIRNYRGGEAARL